MKDERYEYMIHKLNDLEIEVREISRIVNEICKALNYEESNELSDGYFWSSSLDYVEEK